MDKSQLITKEHLLDICFNTLVPKWEQTSDTFPDFLPVFSDEDKKINEASVKELKPYLKNAMKNLLGSDADRFTERFKKAFGKFATTERMIYVSKRLSPQTQTMFADNISGFMRRVREFDRSIKPAAAYQAMRNYLIYSVMEMMNTGSISCPDTAFAFSLLYPYTDNYIDSDKKRPEDKNSFNDLIRAVIRKEDVNPKDQNEEKTGRILETALGYYETDQSKSRLCADLLMYMLEAQENSMRQKDLNGSGLSYREVLDISVYKGCFSVVIDYLFGIDLDLDKTNDRELEFYLSFGLILQLIDDLQDIQEDKGSSQTLMTICNTRKELEHTVNRLFNFIHECMSCYSADNRELLDFITPGCELVTIMAAMKNHSCFSEGYLKKMQKHIPFSS